MRIIFILISSVVALAAAVAPGPDILPTDPDARWWVLDNGLRVGFLPNAEPAGKVSIRMLVGVGGLEETEAEMGLAHYLEHLAFKGSLHYPDGSLIPTLQKMGLQHGNHSNAHTGFDETVYKLDLPQTDDETLLVGLRWFRDVLDGLTLTDEAIEGERGVIFAEMRDRDSAGFRGALATWPTLYPGRRLPYRFPIGTKESVEAITPELMRAFWRRWYRPETAILTISGDVTLEQIQPLLDKTVAKAEAHGDEAVPTRPRGVLETADEQFVGHVDDEHRSDSVRSYALRQFPEPADGPAERRAALARNIANSILGKRISRLAEDPEGPILGGGVSAYDWHDMRHGVVAATVRDGRYAEAISLVEGELRRFLAYGPDASELSVAVAGIRAGLDQAVARASTRTSPGLVGALYGAVRDERRFLSPSQNRELIAPWLDDITAEEVVAVLADAFAPESNRVLVATTREAIAEDVQAELKAAWIAARQAPVERGDSQEALVWPYGDSPDAAAITEQRELGHEITGLAFANGVRAALLDRDDKANDLRFQLRIELEPGSISSAVATFAVNTFMARGTGALDRHQLGDLMAASSVRIGVSRADDGLILSGSALPQDLEQAFQYLRALLTDPGWRSEPVIQAREAWLERLNGELEDVNSQTGRRFTELVTGGHPARINPDQAAVAELTPAVVQEWLTPILAEAPLEIAVVGDMGDNDVSDLVARYFGSLPERKPLTITPDLTADGALAEAAAIPSGSHRISVNSAVARALLLIAWPTDDRADVRWNRRMNLVSNILRNRLRDRLRTVMGAAYSPSIGHRASEVWDTHGFMQAAVSVEPDLIDTAIEAILDEVAQVAAGAIEESDVAQVLTPMRKSLAEYRSGNGYWLGVVANRAWSQPQRIDWAESMVDDYESVTLAELIEAAKILTSEPLVVVGVSEGK